jgi:lactate permease
VRRRGAPPRRRVPALDRATLTPLKWAIVTVAGVLGLAYVMNQSGQTTTLGLWLAGAGSAFAFFSAALGWLGVAITGSDTSSNALLRRPAGDRRQGRGPVADPDGRSQLVWRRAGEDDLTANLAIGAAAVGLAARRATSSRACSAGA